VTVVVIIHLENVSLGDEAGADCHAQGLFERLRFTGVWDGTGVVLAATGWRKAHSGDRRSVEALCSSCLRGGPRRVREQGGFPRKPSRGTEIRAGHTEQEPRLKLLQSGFLLKIAHHSEIKADCSVRSVSAVSIVCGRIGHATGRARAGSTALQMAPTGS